MVCVLSAHQTERLRHVTEVKSLRGLERVLAQLRNEGYKFSEHEGCPKINRPEGPGFVMLRIGPGHVNVLSARSKASITVRTADDLGRAVREELAKF